MAKKAMEMTLKKLGDDGCKKRVALSPGNRGNMRKKLSAPTLIQQGIMGREEKTQSGFQDSIKVAYINKIEFQYFFWSLFLNVINLEGLTDCTEDEKFKLQICCSIS